MTTFKEFGLNLDLMRGLDDLGFEKPSPIQEKAIPFMVKCLVNGHTSDKIVRSLTGMKEKSINYIKEEITKTKDKTVLDSILKLIESKG